MRIESEEGGVRLGVLDRLIGYHMRRASAVIGNDFSRTMAGTGLRQVLFGLLSIVGANSGINQGNAGRALGIQRANVVGLVTELVDMGLVSRKVADDDRRAFALTLTPAGEAKMAECLVLLIEHEKRLLDDLTHAERTQLANLLSRIEAKET